MRVVYERVAGLDIDARQVVACVSVPDQRAPGGRRREVRTFRTFTDALGGLGRWLADAEVTVVAMESTGVLWKPVWYVLEEFGRFELMLVNPQHYHNVPGRKTDVSDAEWLAELASHGLLRASLVPGPAMRDLREWTRYRKKLVQERSREAQRVVRLLEDACTKLGVVVCNIQGKSARAMLEALIAGERDVAVLAELAQGRMRPKIGDLKRALDGRFRDLHAKKLRLLLDHIDYLTGMIEQIDAEVDRLMQPFRHQLARLTTIPGFGVTVAQVFLAETGGDMTAFPTAAQLAGWAKLCPGNHASAGKRRSGKTGRGNIYLSQTLVEAAWAAARTHTYFSGLYGHFLRTFGKKGKQQALVAVAHALLVTAWHVLATDTDFRDLGPDYFATRRDAKQRERYLIRELEKLGYQVDLQPAA